MNMLKITNDDITDIVVETINLIREHQKKIVENTFDGKFASKMLIDEGLIKSHSYKTTIERLLNLGLKKYGVSIGRVPFYQYLNNDGTRTVQIWLNFKYGINQMSKNEFDILLKTINNLGWYISKINNSKVLIDYDNLPKEREFIIVIEPKFDIIVRPEDLPKELYHITKVEVLDKILKQGITPRDGSMFSKHPERVYMFLQKPTNWLSYTETFKVGKNNDSKYALLKIDRNQLQNITNFYIDQNSNSILACYVLEPIPPFAIEIEEIQK